MPNLNNTRNLGNLTALLAEIDDFCGTKPPRKFPPKKDELRDALIASVIQNLAGEMRNAKVGADIQNLAARL